MVDRKSRKILTMHGARHPRVNIDRLYRKRASEERGLIIMRDCVCIKHNSFMRYLGQSEPK